MATLKLYLTSLEPDIEQSICSQSIGGYISNSLLYTETTLASTIGLYDMDFVIDTPASGDWSEWEGQEYIVIGNEMIKVSPIVNNSINVVQRGYNDINNMHITNDIVKLVSEKILFNDVFNDNYKQYRCVAVKNVSGSDPSGEQIAYNFSVYLKQNSRNNDSDIKVALELPVSQYIKSTSTSWSTNSITDTSLIDAYIDDHFNGAYLKILSGGGDDASGQGRIISDFDSSTGNIVLDSPFPSSYDYSINVEYEIYPSPSQRIKTGIISPDINANDPNMTRFYRPSEATPIRFVTEGSVPMIGDLYVNDVVYIWIERTVKKGSEAFNANDMVLNIKYDIRE